MIFKNDGKYKKQNGQSDKKFDRCLSGMNMKILNNGRYVDKLPSDIKMPKEQKAKDCDIVHERYKEILI